MTQPPIEEQGPEYWQRRSREIGQEAGLDPAQFSRLIGWESGYNPTAANPSGAYGLGQFMPETAKAYNLDPTDPEASLRAAAQLIKDNMASEGINDWRQAYAAYFYGAGGLKSQLIDQYGADWEANMDPAYKQELEYIFGGPANEAALATPEQPVANLGRAGIPLKNPSPFAEIPDYFTGYRELLSGEFDKLVALGKQVDFNSQAVNAAAQVSTTVSKEEVYDWYKKQGWTQQQVDTNQALEGLSPEVRKQRLENMPWMAESNVGPEYGPHVPTSMMPTWDDATQAVQSAKRGGGQALINTHVAILDSYMHQKAMFTMEQLLPMLISSGDVRTVDDALTWFRNNAASGSVDSANVTKETNQSMPGEPNFTQTDREVISDLIAKLSPALDLNPDITSAQVMDALTAKNRPTPRLISSMTSENIANMLAGIGKPLEIPEGTTEPQLRAFFRRQGMTDQEYLDLVAGAKANAQTLAMDWFKSQQDYLLYRNALQLPEIPHPDLLDKLKAGMMQPAMALAEGADWLRTNFSKPFAANVILGWNAELNLIGIPPIRGTQSLEDAYDKAIAAGASPWTARSQAFNDWKAPGVVKFVAEVGLDPTTYIGLGLYTNATSKVPVLGPLVAAMEGGFVSTTDIPFRFAGKVYRTIVPKTLEQIGSEMGMDVAARAVAGYARDANRMEGVIGLSDSEGVRQYIEKSIKTFIQESSIPGGDLWEDGKFFVNRFKTLIQEPEAGAWAKSLGATVDVGGQMVQDINYLYSQLFDSGIHGLVKPSEMAQLVLGKMGVEATTESLGKATGLITNRITADNAAISRLFKGDPITALQRASATARDIFVSNAKSKAWQFADQTGKFLGIEKMTWARTASGPLRWTPLIQLDKLFVQPVASAYLLFMGYGPMNFVESTFRMARAGYGPELARAMRSSSLDMVREDLGYLAANIPDELAATGARERMEIAVLPTNGTTTYRAGERMSLLDAIPLPGINRELPLGSIPIINKTPRALRSLQNFNDFWGRVSTYQRALYIHKQYFTKLGKIAPDEVTLIADAFDSVGDPEKLGIFDFITDTSTRQEAYERMWAAAVHGPSSLEGTRVTAEKLNTRKFQSDIADVFASHDIEQPYANAVMREAGRGTLNTETIDPIIGQVFSKAQDDALAKLPAKGQMLKRWADEMTVGVDAAIKPGMSKAESRAAFRQVADAQQQVQMELDLHYRVTTSHGNEMANPIEKDALHTQAYTDTMEFGDTYDESMGRVLDSLRAEATTTFAEGPERTSMFRILDNMQDQYRMAMNFRQEQRRIIDDGIARAPSRGKVNWDAINSERNTLWQDYTQKEIQLQTQYNRAAAMLDPQGLHGSIDMVTGQLAPANVARLFSVTGDALGRGMNDVMLYGGIMSKERFTIYVKSRANMLAEAANHTADDLGFTDKAIGRVYDQIMAKLKLDPSIGGALEPLRQSLEGVRGELHSLYSTKGIQPEAVEKLNQYIGDVAGKLRQTRLFTNDVATPQWASLREQAMDKARLQYELDFTQYGRQNMFDAYARRLMPFWTYESQRWPYLARAMIQTPGVFTGWGKYMDYSDTGYIPIKGTDLEINPFRGTIFMGGFRRFAMRDYPEYQDRIHPGITQFLDYAGKAGFYPGIQVSLPMAIWGGQHAQLGGELPSFMGTALGALVALGVPGARQFQQTILPDNFRDYQIGLVVSERAQQRKLDINGPDILRKRREGLPLSQEENNLWNEATRQVALYSSALFETTGMMRLAPTERAKAWKAVDQMREALTGVPIATQEQIRKDEPSTGMSFSDLFPLSPLDQQKLNNLDSYKYWIGATSPLLPESYQRVVDRISTYWEKVTEIRDTERTVGFMDAQGNPEFPSLNELDQRFKDGTISAADYITKVGDTISHATGLVDGLSQDPFFKDVPKTLDERMAYYADHNIPVPTFSPGQELTWMYYGLSPQMKPDENGNMSYDYDAYYAQVDAVLDAMPDSVKSEFLDYIQRNWTDTQKIYWQSSRDYLRPYRNLRDQVIQMYPAEEQALINEYPRAEKARQSEISQIVTAGGTQLMSDFNSKLSIAHDNFRDISPETDAWLLFWGKESKVRTPSAGAIYLDLLKRYRPGEYQKEVGQ